MSDTRSVTREALAAALDVLSDDGLEYALMAPEEREDRDDAAERLFAALPAEAAPASGLDVERLARALKVHHEQFRKDARLDPCSADCAEPIAAAYEAQP